MKKVLLSSFALLMFLGTVVAIVPQTLKYQKDVADNGYKNPSAEITGYITSDQFSASVTTYSATYNGVDWLANTADVLINGATVLTGVANGTYDVSAYLPINSVKIVPAYSSNWQVVSIDLEVTSTTELGTGPNVSDITVIQGGNASLSAALTGNNVALKWFSNDRGSHYSGTPYTVNTSELGTTTYYVSQADANGIESVRSIITVNVVESQLSISNIGAFTATVNGTDLGADGYDYQLTNNATGGVKYFKSESNSYVLTNLIQGTSYTIAINAKVNGEIQGWNETATFTTLNTNLTVSNVGQTSASVNAVNTGSATKYNYKLTNVGTGSIKYHNVDNSNPLTVLSNLVPGSNYSVSINSFIDGNYAGWSLEETFTTLSFLLTFTNITSTAFTVDVNYSGSATTFNYKIRNTSNGSIKYKTINSVDPLTTITNLDVGVTYAISFCTIENGVASNWSAEQTVTTLSVSLSFSNATPTSFSIDANYTGSATQFKYKIRNTSTGAITYKTINSNDPFTSITDLTPGTTYGVSINPLENGVAIGWTDEQTTSTLSGTSIGIVSTVTITDETATTAVINGEEGVTGAEKYSYQVVNQTSGKISYIHNVSGNPTYNLVNLTNNTSYTVSVNSMVNGEYYGWSDPVLFSTTTGENEGIIQSLYFTGESATQATINADQSGAERYVYQVVNTTFPKTRWIHITNGDPTYTLSNLRPGSVFSVRANSLVNGVWSGWTESYGFITP